MRPATTYLEWWPRCYFTASVEVDLSACSENPLVYVVFDSFW
jgi:hypothetical protein